LAFACTVIAKLEDQAQETDSNTLHFTNS